MQWATERGLTLGRAATVWLVRRLLDPDGEILFVPKEEIDALHSAGAILFESGHPDSHSFHELVEEHFGDNPTLCYIAEIVRGAASAHETDAVPESFGLWAIGDGLRLLDRGAEGAMVIFDALHAHLSKRLTEQERVTFSISHDLVTGLPNRALFNEKLVYAVAYANRQSTMLGVIRIAFDFSGLESSIVRVLREIADRLTHAVREIDAVARISNQEFAVLISGPRHREDAMVAVEKIREILAEPFDVDEGTCLIPSRIGISFYPPHGHDPSTLLRTAGEALAAAGDRDAEMAVFGE